MASDSTAAGRDPAALGDLARLFLRLGTTAFGGPAAHIAMMEDEVVTRRRWLSRDAFLDLVGATNLIPGPNSTELAIHIGYARAGWRGLVVAGVCFIVPAACLVGVLAWAYVQHGARPQLRALLDGVAPVVIAVVGQALWRLGRSAIRSWRLALLAVAAVVAALAGIDEVRILLAAGVLAALVHRTARDDPPPAATPTRAAVMVAAVGPGAAATAGAAVTTTAGLWPVFAFFTKVGALLFGSGYVLLAFLRTGLVVERGWLTEGQLLDAIAIGQVTPGPVFTTATFIGYLLAGPAGAVVATLGIFLPAFLFVAASAPLLPRLRRSPRVGAVLDGVNVASLALMAAVTVPLARAAIVDGATLLLALASAAALLVWRVNATWLVVGGAVAGLALGARG